MAGDGLVGLNCPRGQKEVEISEPESIPDVDLIGIYTCTAYQIFTRSGALPDGSGGQVDHFVPVGLDFIVPGRRTKKRLIKTTAMSTDGQHTQ